MPKVKRGMTPRQCEIAAESYTACLLAQSGYDVIALKPSHFGSNIQSGFVKGSLATVGTIGSTTTGIPLISSGLVSVRSSLLRASVGRPGLHSQV